MTDYDRERQARKKALRQISDCRARLVGAVRGAIPDLIHYGLKSGLAAPEAEQLVEGVTEAADDLSDALRRYQTAATEKFEMRFARRREEVGE